METLLFGVVLIAVGWLVAWCCTDHSTPSETWWPFDMRQHEAAAPKTGQANTRDRPWRNRQPPARPWKRSGS